MNKLRTQKRIVAIFILFLFFQLNLWAQNSSSHRIYVFKQQINLNADLCRESWKVHSPQFADCNYVIPQTTGGIELTKNSLFTQWTYDSTEGWFINFWAKSTSNGFAVTATSEQKIPADRIQFEVAQKYLRDIFAITQNKLVRSVAKSTNVFNGQYEKPLGVMNQFRRRYDLSAKSFLELCAEKAKLTHIGISCVLPLLSTIKGELSAEETFLSRHLSLPKGMMTVTFFSERAWAESASFAPIVFTARWNGIKDFNEFNKAVKETVESLPDKQIDLLIYKPGVTPESSIYFEEFFVQEISLLEETAVFSVDECKSRSQFDGTIFNCHKILSHDEYFLQDNELLSATDISGNFQIRIERKNDKLIYSVTSENKKVESADQAVQLLQNTLKNHNKTSIKVLRIIKALE